MREEEFGKELEYSDSRNPIRITPDSLRVRGLIIFGMGARNHRNLGVELLLINCHLTLILHGGEF